MDLWHLPSPPQQADNLLSRWYQMGLLGNNNNNMNDHHDEQALFPLLCQLMNQSPAMTQVLNSLTDMGELLQQHYQQQQQHEEEEEEEQLEEYDSFSCCDEFDCAPIDLSYDSHSHMSMAQCEHEMDDDCAMMEESPCDGDLWFNNNLDQYDESFVVVQQQQQQYEYQPYECQSHHQYYQQQQQQEEEQLMNDCNNNNNNNCNFMHHKYNNWITECCHCVDDNATFDETQMLSCHQQTNSPHLKEEIAAQRSCDRSMIMSISSSDAAAVAAAPIVHQDVHCQCSSRSEQETASNKNQVENEQLVATMQAIVGSSLSRGKAIVIPDSVATRMNNNNKTMCTDVEPSCAFDSVVEYNNTVY